MVRFPILGRDQMSYLDEILKKQTTMGCFQKEDICCYCGKSGTDKIALPNIFDHPEKINDSALCHDECEGDCF